MSDGCARTGGRRRLAGEPAGGRCAVQAQLRDSRRGRGGGGEASGGAWTARRRRVRRRRKDGDGGRLGRRWERARGVMVGELGTWGASPNSGEAARGWGKVGGGRRHASGEGGAAALAG